jgi:3-phosphoshikimate 1-carboxyvinyltransferase
MRITLKRPISLEGEIILPGDKSISHRAAILNSLANGDPAHISNFCEGDDKTSIIRCLRGIGVKITQHIGCELNKESECLLIHRSEFHEPKNILDAGNSGTTMRLMTGLLAAQPFFSIISGDLSLRSRPMNRVINPLTQMGAKVIGRESNSLAPLSINGGNIKGINYTMPVASAQVKSAIILASLYAEGKTIITEPSQSRDHTERMASFMGADIQVHKSSLIITPSQLKTSNINIPGDISSASTWIIAACCHPNARLKIKNVGLNPSRTGSIDILKKMGAKLIIENNRIENGEPVGDIIAESSNLVGTEISGDIIPKMIDEIPNIAVAACFSKGKTYIKDAAELRFKESDRIESMFQGLSSLGAKITHEVDGLTITGTSKLNGGYCNSYGDHRIAMAMGVAGILSNSETTIGSSEAVEISYPNFWETLKSIQR